MPLVIENSSTAICSLPEAIEALATMDFDPSEESSTIEAAHWLRQLSNNRTFLADILIDRLAGRTSGEIESNYGPQALILSPRRGNMFLRANIWPSEQDLCFKTSGARSFVYGVPHDHNFSFLTSGYLGPGYRSDYFEYDYETVSGYTGEKAGLRFAERSALSEGKLMLYRAHRDVHAQLPAESLSVSLNVMHVDPAQSWFDQYGFDLERGEINRVLSPNTTEVFLRAAVASGRKMRSTLPIGLVTLTQANACAWQAMKRGRGGWSASKIARRYGVKARCPVAEWLPISQASEEQRSTRTIKRESDNERNNC